MSAITILNRELGPDGIRRYRTRWKVLIKSHQSTGTIVLTNSVISVSSSKNIKSVGNLSLALTAERNLLNLVYPNDYINVYCDRADGQGWTRVFFGLVDHLEVDVKVEPQSGRPTTLYTIQCSDFQKAFERTQIYFNPHMAGRRDFDGAFTSTVNIAGAALRTRGILVNGGPADLVLNVILLLLGFGAQFILPTSYNPRLRDRIRQQRADIVLNRLSSDVRDQVMQYGGYANYLEQIRSRGGFSTDVNTLVAPNAAGASDVAIAERARFSPAVIRSLSPGADVARETNFASASRGNEAYTILNTTLAGYPPTLLDVIDLETFVERTAIDGYTNAFSMWSRQDSVLSFMRLVSNEIVNELFLDLRPISRDGGLTAGTDYSRDLDDIEGNRADEEGGVSGILYQPAVVMREYPYATIDYIDATNVPLTLRQRGTTGEADGEFETIGMLNFGAIFSNRPNTPGRHIVTIPGINTEDLALGVSTFAAKKHLDVAVVYDAEIVGTKFSRSDTDHFNLFEIVSDPGSLIGENSRFTMMDLLPIITPVHIMRHGLRVRSLTSIFSRHSLATVNREQPQPSPPPAETTAPPPVAPTSRTVLPVEPDPVGGVYTRGYVGPENQRWYRRNSASGVRRYNGAGSGPIIPADTPLWVFHNGVDIRAPRNTPVRAVRDGIVVAAIPVSVSNTYGNVVMVYHEADDLFSLYAHLERFADNLVRPTMSRALRSYVSTEVKSGGTYSPVRVSAGDVIGYVGDSGSPVRRNAAGVQVAGGVHLHFEFGKKRNGTIYPSSSDRRNGLLPDYFRDPATALPGFPVSTDRPATPSEDLTISQDPVRLFREWGVTLPVGPSVAPGAEDASEDSTGEVDDSPESTVGATPESTEEDPGETTTRSSQPGFVDTPSTRRLLARWALLNDHWYQHNLEYLSGVIEMRGAPEIRAGYRLDLIDRNMSFYVEGVSHNWAYGQPMTTTLHVSRGQPNNPYPVYVLPFLPSFSATDTQRTVGSRLASYFVTPDSLSVRRSLKLERIRSGGLGSPATTSFGALGPDVRASPDTNEVDSSGDSDSVGSRYNEAIIPSVMGETNPEFEQELRRAEEIALGLTGRSSSLASSMSNPQATEAMSSQLDEIFTGSGT